MAEAPNVVSMTGIAKFFPGVVACQQRGISGGGPDGHALQQVRVADRRVGLGDIGCGRSGRGVGLVALRLAAAGSPRQQQAEGGGGFNSCTSKCFHAMVF